MMAGRGRGGSGLSLTQEQLAALGIARGESAAPTLAPPPLFPKLETKPLPLPNDASIDYMLIVQQQFADHLLESAAYVRPQAACADVERYSDKYKMLSADAPEARTVTCVWSTVPAELRPSHVRARASNPRKRKLDRTDIAKRLQTLEKKEIKMEVAEEMEAGHAEGEGDAAPDDEDEEGVEEEQEYEADDGTDYANNYFDNGEELDDDDENLDDGPVY